MLTVLVAALAWAPAQADTDRPAWEYAVAAAAQDETPDDESTGRDELAAAQYLPAPDPAPGQDVFAQQPTGCAALMLGFDQVCLGGLVNRMYSRSISYGLCGALVGSLGGCLVGIIPVLFFASAIDDVNQSQGWSIPNGQSLILPCGLAGAVPGCLGGGGCGVGAGLLSAFLFPFDAQKPPPGNNPGPPPGGYPPGTYGPGEKPPADNNDPTIRHRAPREKRESTSPSTGSGRDGRSTTGRDGRSGREDRATSGRDGRNDSASDRTGRDRPSSTTGPRRRSERNKKRTSGQRPTRSPRAKDRDTDDDDRTPNRSPR